MTTITYIGNNCTIVEMQCLGLSGDKISGILYDVHFFVHFRFPDFRFQISDLFSENVQKNVLPVIRKKIGQADGKRPLLY